MDEEKSKYTQIERALDHFSKKSSADGKTFYNCKLCGEDKNGTKRSNLIGHLRIKHREIYETSINSKQQNPVIDLKVKRLKLLQHLVELITVDKQQFLILQKPSFQKIIAEQLKELAVAGMGINLNDKNLPEIKAHIHVIAVKIRHKLSIEVRGKMISMSIDAVSKNSRSILGIYVQYVHNEAGKVRCLGMKELKQRHTGQYLSTVAEKCLEEFEINLNQVVSLTTDNASNMKTMLRNMNEQLLDSDNIRVSSRENIMANQNGFVSDELIIVENCDAEIADVLHSLDEDDENEIAMLFNDSIIIDDDECWQQNNLNDFDLANAIGEKTTSQPIFVNGVNCAAHTIQLAVKGGLAMLRTDHFNVIKLAREVSKFLRRDNTRIEARNREITLKLVKLDMEPRWSSSYLMVS